MNRSDRIGVSVLLAVGAALLLAACAKQESVALGKYHMTVATDPSPPQVGSDAEVTARVQQPDAALDACRLAFRQFMPEHEMSNDNTWHPMEHAGKGLFRGRGTEFNMGGAWQLEFKLDCGGAVQTAAVPYQLKWPE